MISSRVLGRKSVENRAEKRQCQRSAMLRRRCDGLREGLADAWEEDGRLRRLIDEVYEEVVGCRDFCSMC